MSCGKTEQKRDRFSLCHSVRMCARILNANIFILLSNQQSANQQSAHRDSMRLVFQFNSWFCFLRLARCASLLVSCLSIIEPFFTGQVGHDIDTRTFVRHRHLI